MNKEMLKAGIGNKITNSLLIEEKAGAKKREADKEMPTPQKKNRSQSKRRQPYHKKSIRSEQIRFVTTPELKQKLKDKADEIGISVNEFLNQMVEKETK